MLPEAERSAILRRAKLRSVEADSEQSDTLTVSHNPVEILCKPTTKTQVKSAPNSKNIRYRNCSPMQPMPPKHKDDSHTVQIFPISNFPAVQNPSTGLPDDPVVIEIFTLTRQNADLRRDLRAAQKKITRALESLQSLRRYFRLGLFENQWETYDELRRRMGKLDSVLQYLEDPLGGIEAEEVPDRWRKDKP